MIRRCSESFVFNPAHSCLNCSPIDFAYQKPIVILCDSISPTCRANMLCFGVYVKMYSHNVAYYINGRGYFPPTFCFVYSIILSCMSSKAVFPLFNIAPSIINLLSSIVCFSLSTILSFTLMKRPPFLFFST